MIEYICSYTAKKPNRRIRFDLFKQDGKFRLDIGIKRLEGKWQDRRILDFEFNIGMEVLFVIDSFTEVLLNSGIINKHFLHEFTKLKEENG